MVMALKLCQRCGKFAIRKSKMVAELDSNKKPTGFVRCVDTVKCDKRRKPAKTININSKFDARVKSLL
jgi:hypothetical protein